MADLAISPQGHTLSQVQRVVDTIVAPSETFSDIPRSTSWWLPFVLAVIAAYILTAAIQQKVGWSQLVDNQMRSNPKAEERLAQLTPEQLAKQHRITENITRGAFYAVPVVDLASFAFMAVFLWPTINFVFGGSATYGQVLAVTVFASIPGAIKALLAAILLYAGRSAEEFTADDMLGSNIGYYIPSPGALKTFLTSTSFRLDSGSAEYRAGDCGSHQEKFRLHRGLWLVGADCFSAYWICGNELLRLQGRPGDGPGLVVSHLLTM